MNRRALLGSSAAAVSLALTGVKPGLAADTAPEVIRLAGPGVGYGKNYGLQILGIVRARGLLEAEFRPENIKIEWSFPSGTGPAINEAIASGELDFANYGGQPDIAGKARGLPTRLLASYGNGNSYLLARNGSNIHAIADLKGRKIAVAKGTITQLLFDKLLAANGLSESDLQLFSLQAADQATALSSGDIDATFGDPSLLALKDQGIAYIAFSTQRKITPYNTFGGFLVTENFAGKYPAITQRVVDAYLQGAYWASQEANRQAVYDAFALSGLSQSVIRQEYDGQPLKERFNPILDDFVKQQYADAISFLLKNKVIRNGVDLDAWQNPQYALQGLQTLGYGDFWPPRQANGTLKA